MSSVGQENLSDEEERILRTLEEEGGMRIETIAGELGKGYSEVKSALLRLSDRGLVVSGPEFAYEADRDEIRSPRTD